VQVGSHSPDLAEFNNELQACQVPESSPTIQPGYSGGHSEALATRSVLGFCSNSRLVRSSARGYDFALVY
jgi:hypothetical protein